ncbi:MAG: glycosyltransferase family 4 protein [Eubacteriales bacterium]|nr:glycosyltransferase family 4 protein [Eubacteriales bacterium]
MSKNKRALMLASVASMILQFNEDNIKILNDLGYQVDVAANFKFGSALSQEKIDKYRKDLYNRGTKVNNLTIPRSIFSIKNILGSYKELKKIIKQNDYDLVHCHSPIGGVLCRLACRKARKKGTKVIYTAHGFHFFKGASKAAWAIYYPIEKFCSRFTDTLITINKEDYERAKSFKAKKVEYVPGIGVHTEEFRNVDCSREDLRTEFGFEKDDFVFMSVGQLSVRKNHEVAIKALSRIKDERVKYLLVGFGELEEHLKDLVSQLSLENRVVFAGFRNDIKELLHAVDAFVFPSLQEGLPVSLMEAMAAGLPVVCSEIRGNTDLLEGTGGGYMYGCYDVDDFAHGMGKIVNEDPPKMGEINIETMKKFDINVVNSEMYRIYTM